MYTQDYQGGYNNGGYNNGGYNQGGYNNGGGYNGGYDNGGGYNQGGRGITYTVDMVFCIDVTGSMGPMLNMVKQGALSFYNDVSESMARKNKYISTLRVRVVAFRDYVADGNDAMLVTDFFNLPEQAEDFERAIKSLTQKGGGDEPEDGLEALAYAIRSDWNRQGMKKRQVIVVWTDASTHELGYGSTSGYYPSGMPRTMQELTAWWGDAQNEGYINQNAKRLLLFTPDRPGWKTISDNWDKVIHYPSVAGQGMQEFEYDQILSTIANSI